MAKFISNKVKSGRVGGSVFAVRFGETIERQYNPYVANPKTVAQVEARAKMKLISQMAAVCAPVITIPRQGAVSSRNLFVKENYGLLGYSSDQATIALTSVQLTKSVVALPPLQAAAYEGNLTAYIDARYTLDVNRVVFCLFQKQEDNKLRFVESLTATTYDPENGWRVLFRNVSGTVVVYAYGIRDNTEAASVVFGNMEALTAETVARVVVSRVLTEADITLTETRGAQVSMPSQG